MVPSSSSLPTTTHPKIEPTNTRRKKVVEMKRLAHDMGLDGVLHPLIMDSCHVVLPKERRGERVSRCACAPAWCCRPQKCDVLIDSNVYVLCAQQQGLPSSTPAAVLAAAPPDADGLRKVEGTWASWRTIMSRRSASAHPFPSHTRHTITKRTNKCTQGFFPETFDHVLLDPPCSALGLRPRLTLPVRGWVLAVLGNCWKLLCLRAPAIEVHKASTRILTIHVYQTKVAELRGHVAFQKIFIWSAILLLKPGGTMTYSTCTLNPEENEAMVRFALDTYKCLRLVPAEPRVGGPGMCVSIYGCACTCLLVDVLMLYHQPPNTRITGLPNLGLSDEEQGMVQLFDPSATTAGDAPGLDTSGFFCAKFVKVTSVFESGGDGEAGAGGSE